jgi:UDP-N-acetylmuramoyl-tripeptide--D-alanyl-D-alanine ligase
MMMSLSAVASCLNLSDIRDLPLRGLSIDSRQVRSGDLFVAICGDQHDGHRFIQDAVLNGATAVVCQQAMADVNVPQLVVPDTLQALALIASHHRDALSCQVIALTGSNGKTTVKEMIAAILPPPSFATPGNLNNHIGAPLSVLQLQEAHRYAVFELGASHIGEIAHTSAIVQPHVALINNIAPAHIGEFGSIDAVATAKGEIYQSLDATGIAVVNDDDKYSHYWDACLTGKSVIRFSKEHVADVYARNVVLNTEGCAQFELVVPTGRSFISLAVPGLHNVSNALAAAASAVALQIDLPTIVSGLSRFQGVSGRMMYLRGKHNALIIDDTYNANLRSVLAAIDVLSDRQGLRILVFGDMGELGAWCESHHQQVGAVAYSKGIDRLMTVGEYSKLATCAFGDKAQHYDTQASLIKDLVPLLHDKTTILVKGSRSSQMENIVNQLILPVNS